MKEMEAQIAGLRSSPRARRALEARVSHHLSRRLKRYNRHAHERRDDPEDNEDGSTRCDDSFADESAGRWGNADDDSSSGGCRKENSAGSSSNAGQQRRRACHTSRKGWRRAQGKFMLKSGKPAEAPDVGARMATQTLRAQAVLRRKRFVWSITQTA